MISIIRNSNTRSSIINYYNIIYEFPQDVCRKKCEETHRTAQLPTLAVFLPWGSSEGAGRMPLTPQRYKDFL